MDQFQAIVMDSVPEMLARAPTEPPEFGKFPEGFNHFLDDVVWVDGVNYQGLGYCDDTGDDNDWVVYPGTPGRGGAMLVPTDMIRLATKDEIRSWAKAQQSGVTLNR